MDSFSRNVRDLKADERRLLEEILDQKLYDNQLVIIQIVSMDVDQKDSQRDEPPSTANADTGPRLPEWCNVYDGLSGDEVADLEETILNRADLARSFD